MTTPNESAPSTSPAFDHRTMLAAAALALAVGLLAGWMFVRGLPRPMVLEQSAPTAAIAPIAAPAAEAPAAPTAAPPSTEPTAAAAQPAAAPAGAIEAIDCGQPRDDNERAVCADQVAPLPAAAPLAARQPQRAVVPAEPTPVDLIAILPTEVRGAVEALLPTTVPPVGPQQLCAPDGTTVTRLSDGTEIRSRSRVPCKVQP